MLNTRSHQIINSVHSFGNLLSQYIKQKVVINLHQ